MRKAIYAAATVAVLALTGCGQVPERELMEQAADCVQAGGEAFRVTNEYGVERIECHIEWEAGV